MAKFKPDMRVVDPDGVTPGGLDLRGFAENAEGSSQREDESGDALDQLFSGVREQEEDFGEVPEDIAEVLEENGLGEGNKQYRCILKDVTGSGNTGTAAYVDSFVNAVPSYDYVAKRYGPGDYIFVFSWTGVNPGTDRRKTMSRTIRFQISDKFRDIHEEYLLKRMEERANKKRSIIRHAKLRASLEGAIDTSFDEPGRGKPEENETVEKFLERHAKLNGMLGIGSQPKQSGIDWAEVLKAAAPMVPPLLVMLSDRSKASSESSMQMMRTIIEMQQKNADQTISLLGKQQTPSTGSEMMKEVMGMIMQAVDLKTALSEKEETISDKIFATIQGVVPMIAAMSMNKSSMTGPQAAMARQYIKTDPTMRELENPAIRADVIRRLDCTIGWEQTNQLLTLAEMDRPGDCPMIPEQQYPQGDPRNGAGDAEVDIS